MAAAGGAVAAAGMGGAAGVAADAFGNPACTSLSATASCFAGTTLAGSTFACKDESLATLCFTNRP